MANIIPRAIADVELQIATAIAIGATSFTLNSANDDDGNALPAGLYCFTVDSGTSNKEYLIGQLNGTAVTSVKTVTRQGVETSGAARAHRVGAPAIVTNFAALQRVADILRGALTLDGASPIAYDVEPSLSDREQIATVGYVLDNITGVTVAFDAQTITGNAGESVVANNLVYFKTSDQEWYKTDADTVATIEGVQLGFAKGSGSDGVAISGGIQISGTYTTTGLTAGALYYASNTAGAISTSAGTNSRLIGIALSTTKLLLIPRNPASLKDSQEAALAGGGSFGTPSSTNKFVTEQLLTTKASVQRTYNRADSPATWTKPANLDFILVELWGGGGSGGSRASDSRISAGAGGAYNSKIIRASDLGSTETITIGAGGASVTNTQGNAGGTSSFGSHVSAFGGGAGAASSSTTVFGAGGGGQLSVGNNGGIVAANISGGSPGFPSSGFGSPTVIGTKNGTFGGGGSETNAVGGNSIYGGAAGGGANNSAGGVSVFGGNGGAGSSASGVAATAGAVPGGGGGAGLNAASGAGGNGRVIVTEYYI